MQMRIVRIIACVNSAVQRGCSGRLWERRKPRSRQIVGSPYQRELQPRLLRGLRRSHNQNECSTEDAAEASNALPPFAAGKGRVGEGLALRFWIVSFTAHAVQTNTQRRALAPLPYTGEGLG